MHWWIWVLLGWWLLGLFVSIASIGKTPTPYTPKDAAIKLGIVLVLCTGTVYFLH